MCSSRKYPNSPTEGIGISWGWGVLEKIPSMGEVWIFSGSTQYENRIGLQKQLHCGQLRLATLQEKL